MSEMSRGVLFVFHKCAASAFHIENYIFVACRKLFAHNARRDKSPVIHTGGTVDKLESIPGYNTAMASDSFFKQVNKIGISLIGQTGNLAPADKKLYALRDVTATVDDRALISASSFCLCRPLFLREPRRPFRFS